MLHSWFIIYNIIFTFTGIQDSGKNQNNNKNPSEVHIYLFIWNYILEAQQHSGLSLECAYHMGKKPHKTYMHG